MRFLLTPNCKFIKYILVLTMLVNSSCCKVGYTYINISNSSEKNKYFKAYAIIKNSKENIGWKTLNKLNINGKDEIIINGYDSDELKEFEEEKRIFIVFYDSEKDKNGKEIKSVKDSIIKSYSMKELENLNWEINFTKNGI